MQHAMPQVYKFERLQPLSYYAAAEQSQPMGGLLWGARDNGEEALRARCQMVRQAPCVVHDSQNEQLAMPVTAFSLTFVPVLAADEGWQGLAALPRNAHRVCLEGCVLPFPSRHPMPQCSQACSVPVPVHMCWSRL